MAAAKPRIDEVSGKVVQLKITPVGVYGRGHGVSGVKHQTQAAGVKLAFTYSEILLHGWGKVAVYSGNVYPGFFQHLSTFQYPGSAASTFGAVPEVFPKAGLSICRLQTRTNAVLKALDVGKKLIFHGGLRHGITNFCSDSFLLLR